MTSPFVIDGQRAAPVRSAMPLLNLLHIPSTPLPDVIELPMQVFYAEGGWIETQPMGLGE